MPQPLSTHTYTHALLARASHPQRFMRAAMFALLACAGVFAQSAPSPPTKRPGAGLSAPESKAKAATDEAREQPGAPPSSVKPRATDGLRARRINADSPAAAASPDAPAAASPASTVAAPKAAAAVTTKAAAPKVVAKSEAKRAKGVEGELAEMRAEIESAKADAERARLERVLTDRLVALNRTDDALAEMRLWLHADRFDPPYFFNLGNALARLGDDSAATDAYRKAISQRRGHYARALNNLGVILIRQGHLEEARTTLTAALLQENNAYAEASYNLGRLHLLDGQPDLAIGEWQRTLRLEPAHAGAAAALSRAYRETGDPKRALAVIEAYTARATRTGAGVPPEIDAARRELAEAAPAPAAADTKKDAGQTATPPRPTP